LIIRKYLIITWKLITTLYFGIWQLKNTTTTNFESNSTEKFYYAIQAFQGEGMINAIGHVRDIHIKVFWFNLHTTKYKIGYKRFYYTLIIFNAKAFGEWLCV